MSRPAADADDLYDLYRELILDHARNPRNFGSLGGGTLTADGVNPLCGDRLKLYVDVDAGNRIRAAAFEGSGCAISIASASLLTEAVTGLSVDNAEAVFSAVTNRLTQRHTEQTSMVDVELDGSFDKLQALDGVREFPSRVKCATLAWHALHSALSHEAGAATTE